MIFIITMIIVILTFIFTMIIMILIDEVWYQGVKEDMVEEGGRVKRLNHAVQADHSGDHDDDADADDHDYDDDDDHGDDDDRDDHNDFVLCYFKEEWRDSTRQYTLMIMIIMIVMVIQGGTPLKVLSTEKLI